MTSDCEHLNSSFMRMDQMRRGSGRPPKATRGERKPHVSRFFNIILPAILEQNSLRIPEKFAATFSSEFSVAKLRVPTGLVWKVAVSRSKNKLCFTQGWKEFMIHNAIKLGYFLEFEYRGKSNFKVHIFDLSCCEIDYPSRIPSCPSECADANQCSQSMEVKDEEEGEKMVDSKLGNLITPSFTITMRKNHCLRNELFVPMSFMRNYMLKKYVKIQADDGREWNLQCNYYNSSLRLSGSGWAKFRKANNLKLGDVCTFKLVGEDLLSVTFKALKSSSCSVDSSFPG